MPTGFAFADQKTRPETSGVPAGKTVSESTAPGTVLFEVDPDDPDNGETYTHSWTSDPLADDMFELDPISTLSSFFILYLFQLEIMR